MDLNALRVAVSQGKVLASTHATLEALAEGLRIGDIWASLLAQDAEIIENYPTDPRGPSCLALTMIHGRPVHLVVAFPAKRHAAQLNIPAVAVLITVYRPDLRPWEWSSDYRTRQSQP